MGGADSVNENHDQDDLALKAREGLGKGGAAERATFVVGIGASAGGLEPLEAFFRAMPPRQRGWRSSSSSTSHPITRA